MISNKEAIGKRIKILREEKGEIQADVAKKLNVKRETVNQWENGKRDLKTEYIVKLADYFNVTCDYILQGVEADNVDIHKKTGLSDEAINMLEMLSQGYIEPKNNKEIHENDRYKNSLETINLLLSSEDGLKVISCMTQYFNVNEKKEIHQYSEQMKDQPKIINIVDSEIIRGIHAQYTIMEMENLRKTKERVKNGKHNETGE